jgi:hypothetical protein
VGLVTSNWQQAPGLESCSPICPEDAALPFDGKSGLWFCSLHHHVGARTPTLRMAKQ